MHLVGKIAQVVIALGILNVWLLRFNQPTAYRGKAAANMREEFAAYGLPAWAMWLIGGLKITLAAGLIAGLWLPALVLPCGVGMAILMIGAIAMHFKVGDRPIRALPAVVMLVLSILAVTL
jgi:hypothetical protein